MGNLRLPLNSHLNSGDNFCRRIDWFQKTLRDVFQSIWSWRIAFQTIITQKKLKKIRLAFWLRSMTQTDSLSIYHATAQSQIAQCAHNLSQTALFPDDSKRSRGFRTIAPRALWFFKTFCAMLNERISVTKTPHGDGLSDYFPQIMAKIN